MKPNEGNEVSTIWDSAFSEQNIAKNEPAVQTLKEEYQRTRRYASFIGAEIARDLPEHTVHDITHSDALWDSADVVCGEDYALTPPEAFVLGIAFLVHDLAMGSAALTSSPDQTDLRWKDLIVADLSVYYGRNPTAEEVSDPPMNVWNSVKSKFLRELHAEHAPQILEKSFQDGKDGQSYYLISDPDLRDKYGHLAGQIAASHGWNVDSLSDEFRRHIGSPATMPSDWTIDPLKLACIMRTADAAQLDSRRAPPFLRALRRPGGQSRAHWIFQQRLQRPRRNGDRLEYTATKPFAAEDSEAWWLCHDFLNQVDHELRSVDSLLSDSGREQFAARAVSGVESAARLSSYIPVQGWHPVKAQVHVSNAVQLVGSLGGEELYGRDPHVPLRELISNAADAARAKKCLLREEGYEDAEIPRSVTVGIEENDSGTYLVVSDTGIGMSERVLTDALLGFGESYWASPSARHDFPGLLSSGFHSTGQYGIGFFSVFMLGDKITIASRRYDEALDKTRVLEFKEGLGSRPVLREASKSEKPLPLDGGTTIKVLLHKDMRNRLLWRGPDQDNCSLGELCAWLCPTLDVDLYVREHGTRHQVIQANDWMQIEARELLTRLDPKGDSAELTKASDRLADITIEGELVGRAAIAANATRDVYKYDGSSSSALITVGGVRSKSYLKRVTGVLLGKSRRASRDYAKPLISKDKLAPWASEQGAILAQEAEEESQENLAHFVRSFNGDVGDLYIAECYKGHITSSAVRELARSHGSLLLMHDAEWSTVKREHEEARLREDVIVLSMGGIPSHLDEEFPPSMWDTEAGNGRTGIHSATMLGLIVEIVAAEWEISPDILLDQIDARANSEFFPSRRAPKYVSGYIGDEPIKAVRAFPVYNPASTIPVGHWGVDETPEN